MEIKIKGKMGCGGKTSRFEFRIFCALTIFVFKLELGILAVPQDFEKYLFLVIKFLILVSKQQSKINKFVFPFKCKYS